MAVVPPRWGRCPGNQLGGTWQHLGAAERQNSTTAFSGKTCLHAGSSPQKRSPELRRLNFQPSLTHSPPAPLTYSTSSRSPAQLDQSRARKTRRGQPSPLRSSPLLLLHSQRPTSHFHISIHSREMHCCCHRYPSRAVRVLNLSLL